MFKDNRFILKPEDIIRYDNRSGSYMNWNGRYVYWN